MSEVPRAITPTSFGGVDAREFEDLTDKPLDDRFKQSRKGDRPLS